jgi:hypothetical protein
VRTKAELLELLNSIPQPKQQPRSGGEGGGSGGSGGTKLTPEQVAYHLARFNAKTYTTRDAVPMSPRAIMEVERQENRQKKKE